MKITTLNNNILFIDYSGVITHKQGILNMEIIEKSIRELALSKKTAALVFDIRNTIWENQETHNTLSAVSRKKFNASNFGFTIYTAIVNNSYEHLAFENEHWFYDKTSAIKWLQIKIQDIKSNTTL